MAARKKQKTENPIDYVSLGRRISFARKEAGVTQADLSKKLDISVQYLSAIENAKRAPSLDLLAQIARVLDTSLDELLYDTLPTSHAGYDREVQELLSCCSPEQQDLLLHMMRGLRQDLRKYTDAEGGQPKEM